MKDIKNYNVEYKDIEGYEGLYAITVDGRVWSYKTKKFLSPAVNGGGYLRVSLVKDKKQKSYFAHRLVAAAFIPNPLGLPQVNHINEIKDDNRVENLEWCDSKYNNNHGTRNQRISKSVYCVELDKTFASMTEAAMETNVDVADISKCCNGKRKSAKGLHFRFSSLDDDLKITFEKDNDKVDWYVSGKEMDKMLVDRETAIALHYQLIKENMGIAFPPAN